MISFNKWQEQIQVTGTYGRQDANTRGIQNRASSFLGRADTPTERIRVIISNLLPLYQNEPNPIQAFSNEFKRALAVYKQAYNRQPQQVEQ